MRKNVLSKYVAIALCSVAFVGGQDAFAAPASATGTNAYAVVDNAVADGLSAIAIGAQSEAKGERTIAVGQLAKATATNAVAIGFRASSPKESSTAVGFDAHTDGEYATAYGTMTQAMANNATAIGHGANALGEGATALGTKSMAKKIGGTAVGTNANSLGEYSSAFGNGAIAEGKNATALGYGAKAEGASASATGVQSVASGEAAVANGYVARATSKYSTALGSSVTVTGASSVGVGSVSTVSGAAAGSVGFRNTVAQANTYVMGNNITSSQANSVILGAGSADRAATVERTATVNGLKYSDFAGAGAPGNGVVSVGAVGKERQLINVASGKIASNSTDAINGSQLYAAMNTVGNVASTTAGIFGGDAQVASDGKLTMTNIGTTGENTIHDAIKAAYEKDSSVVAGSANVTVDGSGTNATGGKEYKVDIARDLTLDSVTTGNTTVSNTGVTVGGQVYVSEAGLNANSKKITNLANGEVTPTSTDAINGSQLYQATHGMMDKVEQLDGRLSKVGAGAAALAALHPVEFDSEDKWSFAAGFGAYSGARALAVGAFYRPNEDTMLSVATSLGNGQNMVNAGVSFKLGDRDTEVYTRKGAQAEIKRLEAKLEEMDQKYNQLLALVQAK